MKHTGMCEGYDPEIELANPLAPDPPRYVPLSPSLKLAVAKISDNRFANIEAPILTPEEIEIAKGMVRCVSCECGMVPTQAEAARVAWKGTREMKRSVIIAIVLALTAWAMAQTPEPPKPDMASINREISRLRAEVAKLARENKQLKEEIEALKAENAKLGSQYLQAVQTDAPSVERKNPTIPTPTGDVVYLIDYSGSMTDVFDIVAHIVREQVLAMDPSQSAKLVLASDKVMKSSAALTPATDAGKATMLAFLQQNRKPFGRSVSAIPHAVDDAHKALAASLADEKVIYLITDGTLRYDLGKLSSQVRNLNRRSSVKYHVILISNSSSQPSKERDALQKLATSTSGEFIEYRQGF